MDKYIALKHVPERNNVNENFWMITKKSKWLWLLSLSLQTNFYFKYSLLVIFTLELCICEHGKGKNVFHTYIIFAPLHTWTSNLYVCAISNLFIIYPHRFFLTMSFINFRSGILDGQPKLLLSLIPNYPLLNFMLTTSIYVAVSILYREIWISQMLNHYNFNFHILFVCRFPIGYLTWQIHWKWHLCPSKTTSVS